MLRFEINRQEREVMQHSEEPVVACRPSRSGLDSGSERFGVNEGREDSSKFL